MRDYLGVLLGRRTISSNRLNQGAHILHFGQGWRQSAIPGQPARDKVRHTSLGATTAVTAAMERTDRPQELELSSQAAMSKPIFQRLFRKAPQSFRYVASQTGYTA